MKCSECCECGLIIDSGITCEDCSNKYSSKNEALMLQTKIVNCATRIQEIGFRVEIKYIGDSGIVVSIINRTNGELHEQDKLDAQQEKNNDYALDNMTCDISPEEQELMDLENASLDQFNQEREEMEQIELESESRNVTPETIIKDWSVEEVQ
tara:strand:+ start:12076 stop:12534 length:459 start_codon:yes stop_codon:yes gene_type:complete